MTKAVFVDTNIFVYARDSRDTAKSKICSTIVEKLWQSAMGRTSCQVLSELYVTLTQKLSPGLDQTAAWQEVRDLMAWAPVAIDMELIVAAKEIQENAKLSWSDALIVAAAARQSCELLVSEDMQHDRVLFGLRIINPFKPTALKYLS